MIVRLGQESRQLYERLVESGWKFFGLKEAMACSGKSNQASRKLLERLVLAGWVVKLQRDRYGLRRDGEEIHPLVVGRELCGGSGYYVSYGSAMAVWGMVDQTYPQGVLRDPQPLPEGNQTYPPPQPTACFAIPEGRGTLSDPIGKGEEEKVVTISLTDGRRMRKRTVLGWEYRFVADAEIGERRLVGRKEKPSPWKVVEVEIPPGSPAIGKGERVWVSDPEWTIVCGLGRPDLCGGVRAVAEGMERWRERIDLEKLMRYAMHIRNRTAARRLGFLLDELRMGNEATRAWLELTVKRYYGKLEPGQPWAGDLERAWRLDVNDSLVAGNST